MADAFVAADRDRQGTARYLTALREHWLLIAVLVVIAVAAAAASAFTAEKRYEAETDILVTPVSATDETFLNIDVLRESLDPQSRSVLTAAQLIKTPEVGSEVRRRLGGDN